MAVAQISIKTLSAWWMENGMVEGRSPEVVVTEILARNTCNFKMMHVEPGIREKQIYCLYVLLVSGGWGLVVAFFRQFLFQAAFTITVHHWFIPVLAEIFSYIVLVGIILSNYYHLAKGLQQYTKAGYYGY